jgi:hypothetical protein
MQAPVLELLPEADLVPVGIENHRHPLAPVHVLGLAGDLDAGFPKSRDLGVDVVAVEPKRTRPAGSIFADRAKPSSNVPRPSRTNSPSRRKRSSNPRRSR